jgi:hypothetical protein
MDDQTAPAADDDVAITLVIRRASEPLDGTITLPDQQPVHFTGWMQLTQLLARVLDPAR